VGVDAATERTVLRRAAVGAVVLLAACATACGSAANRAASTTQPAASTTQPDAVTTTDASSTTITTSTTTTPSTTSAGKPTTSLPPTVAPPAVGRPTSIQVTDAAKGATTSVTLGSTITVVLHSTYWTIDPPTGPVLAAAGPQSYAPGQGCGATVPGSGCGTVTLVVRAAAEGTSVITAQRTSCGEALRCTPDQSTWSVTVRVTA
jgi:hypothetical protein